MLHHAFQFNTASADLLSLQWKHGGSVSPLTVSSAMSKPVDTGEFLQQVQNVISCIWDRLHSKKIVLRKLFSFIFIFIVVTINL